MEDNLRWNDADTVTDTDTDTNNDTNTNTNTNTDTDTDTQGVIFPWGVGESPQELLKSYRKYRPKPW